MTAHSHTWINLDDPPISRTPYVPIIGRERRQMHPGETYTCRDCGLSLTIPDEPEPVCYECPVCHWNVTLTSIAETYWTHGGTIQPRCRQDDVPLVRRELVTR